MLSCTLRSYWGADTRPKRLLFTKGNSQERLVLETAQRLQQRLLTAFDHSSESLSMGWPWGKRPALEGSFNDLPAKNKANRLLAAARRQQESRYFIPTHSMTFQVGDRERARRRWAGLWCGCHLGLCVSLGLCARCQDTTAFVPASSPVF